MGPIPLRERRLTMPLGFVAGSAQLSQLGLSLVGDPVALRTGPGDPLCSLDAQFAQPPPRSPSRTPS